MDEPKSMGYDYEYYYARLSRLPLSPSHYIFSCYFSSRMSLAPTLRYYRKTSSRNKIRALYQ